MIEKIPGGNFLCGQMIFTPALCLSAFDAATCEPALENTSSRHSQD